MICARPDRAEPLARDFSARSQQSLTALADPGKVGSRPKSFILDMFPYPSGEGLHVGHPEGYTATDIVCRYSRMRGKNDSIRVVAKMRMTSIFLHATACPQRLGQPRSGP